MSTLHRNWVFVAIAIIALTTFSGCAICEWYAGGY